MECLAICNDKTIFAERINTDITLIIKVKMQNQMYIFLDKVKLFARHGVAEQETVVGSMFIIDLKLKVDFSRALISDKLEYTVSYADVYETVKEEMEIPSKLLEHVAGRITRRLFNQFSEIERIELRLTKQNPPMGADSDGAGVILVCER